MINKLKKTIRANKVIVQNLSYLSILQLFNMAVPLLTYPYLIRVLGKETYGLVIFAQALVGYLVILVNFGFNISATKEISVHRNDKNKISEIVSSVFILKGILFLVSIGILFILLYVIPQAEGYKILFYLTMYLCLYDWLFPIWYFQGIERMKYITILNVCSRTIFVVLIFLFIKNQDDYLLFPIISGLGAIVASIIALYIVFKLHKVKLVLPSKKSFNLYFKESIPIFSSTVSIKLYISSNKVIIGAFLGMGDVAIYDLAEKIVNVLKAPQSILSQVLFPKISKDKNVSFIKKVFIWSLILHILMIVILGLIINPIVLFLGGSEMFQANLIIILLSLTIPIILMSNFYGIQLLIPFNHEKTVLRIVFSSFLFYSGLVFFLYVFNSISLINITTVIILTELFVTIFMYRAVKKYQIL